ncbi:MAG: hypothetical protein PHO46_01985 [Thermoguttaceae bacterium]|nr:hypothetical protein [Thermoguttaceae bacterium]
MARLSGVIMSAILVVLCLWLSVFSFPNVIREGDLPGPPAKNLSAAADANNASSPSDSAIPVEFQSSETRVSPEAQESTEAASPQSSEKPSQEGAKSPDESNFGYANTSLAIDMKEPTRIAGREAEDAIKESGRAQGGKYVSIPAVDTDVFRRPAGSPYTDRVISTTRANVPTIVPASYH